MENYEKQNESSANEINSTENQGIEIELKNLEEEIEPEEKGGEPRITQIILKKYILVLALLCQSLL